MDPQEGTIVECTSLVLSEKIYVKRMGVKKFLFRFFSKINDDPKYAIRFYRMNLSI